MTRNQPDGASAPDDIDPTNDSLDNASSFTDAAADAADDCYTWLNTPVGAVLRWHYTASPPDDYADCAGENTNFHFEHFNASSVAAHVILIPGFWIDENGSWRTVNPYRRTGTVLTLDGWGSADE